MRKIISWNQIKNELNIFLETLSIKPNIGDISNQEELFEKYLPKIRIKH